MLSKPSFLPEKPLQAPSTGMTPSTVDRRRHADLLEKLQRLKGDENSMDPTLLLHTSSMANVSTAGPTATNYTNVAALSPGLTMSANAGSIGIGIGAGVNPNMLSVNADGSCTSSSASSMNNSCINNPPIVNTGNNGPMCVQPGDWMCSSCGFVNWRRRKVCMRCYPFADANEISQSIANGALLAAQLAAGVENCPTAPPASYLQGNTPVRHHLNRAALRDEAASFRSVSSSSGNSGNGTHNSKAHPIASLPMRPDLQSSRQQTKPNWLPKQQREESSFTTCDNGHTEDETLVRHVSLHHDNSRSTTDIDGGPVVLRTKLALSSLPPCGANSTYHHQPHLAAPGIPTSFLDCSSSTALRSGNSNSGSIWRFPASPAAGKSIANGASTSSNSPSPSPSASSSTTISTTNTLGPSSVYRSYKPTTIFAASTSASPPADVLMLRYPSNNSSTTTAVHGQAHSPSPWLYD